MKNAYQKTLELVSQLTLQEQFQLKSDLEEMTKGDLVKSPWVDAALSDGEASIFKDGVQPLTDEVWSELKAPYGS